MNSPSVVLLSIVFASICGGANATHAQNMSEGAGAESLNNGVDVVLFLLEPFVSQEEKIMRKWKLGLAGPQPWGSMNGGHAPVLGGMDGVKHTLHGHDEVTLDGFKQFVGLHLVKSQRTTIPVDGAAK
jgi:hypothetical protein